MAPSAPWSGQASVQTDSFLSETGVFRVHWESQSHGGMHEDPCEFFLVIDASGVTWKVSLEEGLRTLAPNPQFD